MKRKLKQIIAPRVRSFESQLRSIENNFLARGKRSPFRGRQPSLKQKISLIVATYNVEKYIDDFMRSIFNQSTGLINVEIIVVDDGSTDSSGELARKWQAAYPKVIKYIHQENQGASEARNVGMNHATGDWLTFPDPDDILDRHYFHHVNIAINRPRKSKIALISTNLVLYYEKIKYYSDSHPLSYKYKSTYTERPSKNMGEYMQLSAASCFIKADLLRNSGLKFESNIKPNFEDASLINKFICQLDNHGIGFVKDAIYNYRRREDGSSLVASARVKREWYIDQLRHGYLDLLKSTTSETGETPRFIQRTILYDISSRFKHLANQPERISHLSESEVVEFLDLLQEIFTYIEEETIRSMSINPIIEIDRLGLLAMFKDDLRAHDFVYVNKYDKKNHSIQFTTQTGGDAPLEVSIFVNGKIAENIDYSKQTTTFLERTYATKHSFWIKAVGNAELRATISGRPARIKRNGEYLGDRVTVNTIINKLRPPAAVSNKLPASANRLRAYATSNAARKKFKNCWVLMDRDDVADDNAEHLYRYMMNNGRTPNAYFVLRSDSPDWNRLELEGFNLLRYGSDQHVAAIVNASIIASSHTAHFVRWPVKKEWLQDLVNYKFAFLQHGTIKDDHSSSLNNQNYDLFVTSATGEYNSIAGVESNYLFSSKEVKLTGLPRHDALLKTAKSNDIILIMPTWRNYLTAMNTAKGAMPERIDGFIDSDYAIAWSELLSSEELKSISNKYGKKIVFCPHPNTSIYMDDMNIPEWVETVSPNDPVSYQKLFSECATLITDYSSVAFDCAYIDKSVIYYQFDRAYFFDSNHGYRRGYFDYPIDGMGPVTDTLEQTLTALKENLTGNEPSVYASRRQNFFPFHDGKSCERVFEAIEELLNEEPNIKLG